MRRISERHEDCKAIGDLPFMYLCVVQKGTIPKKALRYKDLPPEPPLKGI